MCIFGTCLKHKRTVQWISHTEQACGQPDRMENWHPETPPVPLTAHTASVWFGLVVIAGALS